MQRSSSARRVIGVFRDITAMLLAAGMVTTGWAQETSSMPAAPSAQGQSATATTSKPFDVNQYSRPRTHLPNLLAPYSVRHVDSANIANTSRIDQLLRDGKLYISMNDAVALALENNLDIAIARYNLNIADTDVWRAKAGSVTLGVNTGVVQNTPGGNGIGVGSTTSGGGAGGTSVGIGGAGAGTGGIVSATTGVGAAVPSFDPILTGTLQLDQSVIEYYNPFQEPFTFEHTNTWNFSYQQGFHWGSNLTVAFNNNRVSASPLSTYQALSTQYSSNFRATVTQPLLSGFGFLPNTRFIMIAKNNREISDVAFRLQVITTVNQIQNIYWDLVSAYENVKVQQDALAFAERTLSDTRKQVDIGTLAPIEIVRAQSTTATNQQQLIVAKTTLQLQQLLMKNALSRTLVDPVLADAEVIPTDVMAMPEKEAIVPTEDLVTEALQHRAEIAESRIDLTNRGINSRSAKNAMRPTLNLFAYYQGSGQGGTVNPSYVGSGSQLPPDTYGGGLSQLVDSTAPDKGVGLQMTIPIRNRTGQANQVRADLELRQAQMALQQQENRVRIEVRNAQFSVQQNRAAVESAEAATELAKQSLDAEQKKYNLGASTSTLVLQYQAALTQAESNLVMAMSNYEKSRVELDRSIGATLARLGILMNDAERGEVTKMPAVPDVKARPADQPLTLSPQRQQQ